MPELTAVVELEAELARIRGVLAEGVVRVQSGDRSKQYDLAQVRKRHDDIVTELDRYRRRPMVRQVRTFSTKGY